MLRPIRDPVPVPLSGRRRQRLTADDGPLLPGAAAAADDLELTGERGTLAGGEELSASGHGKFSFLFRGVRRGAHLRRSRTSIVSLAIPASTARSVRVTGSYPSAETTAV